MSHNTGNTTAFIEAQQYSSFIVANLPEIMLPDTFSRDVSDFGSGTTLNIKTVGAVTIQDVAEEQPITLSNIDTGTVTLSIANYVGDGWAVTDDLREDGAQVEQLLAMRSMESTRALAEYFESKFLAACNSAQTNSNANLVNGFAHRIVSAESNNVISIDHFRKMKLAFDKAKVPQMGRIAIVDPVVEATLNGLTNIVQVTNNPMFEGIITSGFAAQHKFVRNIFGFDIYVSNMLPTGSMGDGTTTVASAVANVFMCVADDQCKPIMRAWRRQPKVETQRNFSERRDEFQVSARFGLGAQRTDTLGIVATSASNY